MRFPAPGDRGAHGADAPDDVLSAQAPQPLVFRSSSGRHRPSLEHWGIRGSKLPYTWDKWGSKKKTSIS